MIRAKWQSGDAPEGVVEYQLGSLRPGQRFVSYGSDRKSDIRGTVIDLSACAVLVELDRPATFREFVSIDQETGEAKSVRIAAGPKRITWAATAPVGIEEE